MSKKGKKINLSRKRIMYESNKYESNQLFEKIENFYFGKVNYYEKITKLKRNKETKEFEYDSEKTYLRDFKYVIFANGKTQYISKDYNYIKERFDNLTYHLKKVIQLKKLDFNRKFLKNYEFAMVLVDHNNKDKEYDYVLKSKKALDELYLNKYYNRERVLFGKTKEIYKPIFENIEGVMN